MEYNSLRNRLRRIAWVAALAPMLLFNAPTCRAETRNFVMTPSAKDEIIKKAAIEERGGVLILRLAGSPYEMGYQRGALLKDSIRKFFREDVIGYLDSEEKKRRRGAFPNSSLARYFRSKAKSLEAYIPREYREELKGLSDGCGLSYDDLLLMHTAVDTASLSRLDLEAVFRDKLKAEKAVIFYAPESGNRFVTVGPVGIIGALTGMNEKGVTLDETGYGKTREFAGGVPVLFLFRQWLQYSDSPYDAIRIVSSSRRTITDSVIVADTRVNEGCVIDFDPKAYDAAFETDKVAGSLRYFIKLKDEFNIAVTDEKPIDPFEFYSYEKSVPEYKLEPKERTREYQHYSFDYPSVVETDYPNNRVFADFYEPKGYDKYPVVIFISHTTGSIPQIEGEFCRDLASNGIAALLIQTAYQKNFSFSRKWFVEKSKERGADELLELLRQLVIETRRSIDWLETRPGVMKDRIGVMGISLGGILVPVVAGVDDRINCAAIVLGGGDMGDILWNSVMTGFFKERLISEGIDSAQELEEKMWVIDPLTFSFKAKKKPVIMINAHFDINIPRSSTLKLWRALGKPKLIWLPSVHATSIFEIGYAKIKTFQYFYEQLVNKKKAEEIGFDYTPSSPLSAFRLKPGEAINNKLKVSVTGKWSGFGFGDDEMENKSLRLGIFAKDLFENGYFGGSEAFGRQEKDDRYRLDGLGGALLFGLRLSETSNAFIKYSYEAVDVYHAASSAPTEITRHIGSKGVSTASFTYERSTYDDGLYPIDGSYRNVTVDVASSILGGDFNFLRTSGETTWYITTPHPKVTFVFRIKGGWEGEYAGSADVPFYERFYAGSSDTIRGYELRFIGPKDSKDLSLGGDVMTIGNIEVRFPLFSGLNGALFYDVGGVWERISDVRLPDDLKSSVGTGLRYRIKWTVLRLDYGYPLNRNPGDAGKFHFGLGVPF